MTKREAAIVAAYTGILIGTFSDMHAYVEKKLGRPVWTHQFPSLRDEIENATRADFIAIPITDKVNSDWQRETFKSNPQDLG